MVIKALIEHWFSFMLGKLKKHPEAFKKLLALHWGDKLDEGAQKTCYVYMIALDRRVHWNACSYSAEKYYNQYFDKSCSEWVVHNPSAALVATVRMAFFDDYVFAWAFLVVEMRSQASTDKLQ